MKGFIFSVKRRVMIDNPALWIEVHWRVFLIETKEIVEGEKEQDQDQDQAQDIYTTHLQQRR